MNDYDTDTSDSFEDRIEQLQSQLAAATETIETYKEALAKKFNAELCVALDDSREKLAAEQEKNKRLRGALENCRETIQYVKQYVEKRGLSAEDDCNESLEKIEQALSGE